MVCQAALLPDGKDSNLQVYALKLDPFSAVSHNQQAISAESFNTTLQSLQWLNMESSQFVEQHGLH